MAKRPTIIELTSSYGSQTAVNTSLINIRNQFDNTLSRDGSSPNNMEADLDMDSNDILNVGNLYAESLYIDGLPVTTQEFLVDKWLEDPITLDVGQRMKFTGDNGGLISQLVQLHPVQTIDRPSVTWYDTDGVMQAAIMWHEDDLTSGLTQNSWDLKTKDTSNGMITRLTVDSGIDKANMTLNELRSINHRYNGEDVWRSRPETEGKSIRIDPNGLETDESYLGFSGDRLTIGYNGGDGYVATASGKEFKVYVNAQKDVDEWTLLANNTEFLVDNVHTFFVRKADGNYIIRNSNNNIFEFFEGLNESSSARFSGRAEIGYDSSQGAAYLQGKSGKTVRLYDNGSTGTNWRLEAGNGRVRFRGYYWPEVVAFSTLPAANTVPGARAMVTLHNQVSFTYGGVVATGASTAPIPVFSNGTNWIQG